MENGTTRCPLSMMIMMMMMILITIIMCFLATSLSSSFCVPCVRGGSSGFLLFRVRSEIGVEGWRHIGVDRRSCSGSGRNTNGVVVKVCLVVVVGDR